MSFSFLNYPNLFIQINFCHHLHFCHKIFIAQKCLIILLFVLDISIIFLFYLFIDIHFSCLAAIEWLTLLAQNKAMGSCL